MLPFRALVILLPVVLACSLVGCISDEVRPTSPERATGTSRVSTPDMTSSSPDKLLAGRPPATNPVVIFYEKLSVRANDKYTPDISSVAEYANTSRKLVVTGFCDRRQVANPINAAVTRAVSVRDELIRRGVPPSNIQVKAEIVVPNKHAVEIRFE
jgi:hypothetical protein